MMRGVALLLMGAFILHFSPLAQAQDGKEDEKPAAEEKERRKLRDRGKEESKGDAEKGEGEKGASEKEGLGSNVPEKARIVFVTKNPLEGGKVEHLVWIRLTPVQYRSAKARATARRRGFVRIVLGPRQLLALNQILERKEETEQAEKRAFKKVLLRVRAKKLRTRRGIKAHYVVRPLELFTGAFKDGVLDEEVLAKKSEEASGEGKGEEKSEESGRKRRRLRGDDK